MDKIVQITSRCWIRIKWSPVTKRLSITGVDHPTRKGDARSSGQIVDYIDTIPTPSLTIAPELRDQIVSIWNRWHLNDSNAGTPKQMQALRDAKLGSHHRREVRSAMAP